MLLHYYRSIQGFNFLFSCIAGALGMIGGEDRPGAFFSAFLISFFTGGYLLALFFYELRSRQQYYFYYNRGFSRLRLILFSYLLGLPVIGLCLMLKNILA